MSRPTRARLGPLAGARVVVVCGVLFLLLLLVMAFAVSVGAEGIDLLDALRSGPGTAAGDILFVARIPRLLLAAIAGAALAATGVAFQALLRNPLADPYVLGVSAGAALRGALATPPRTGGGPPRGAARPPPRPPGRAGRGAAPPPP